MSKNFSSIRQIIATDKSTWADQIFLTFDIDWACDEVLSDAIDLVERADVHATWFVTHETKLLQRLRRNPKFELGIHPNFNNLLEGNYSTANSVREVVEKMLAIVPEALSVRSHSMTQSSRVLDCFRTFGLAYDCNHFIPAQAGMVLKPWHHWNGLTKVPYFWEDDVSLIYSSFSQPKELCCAEGLKVFDFHPIHVFLNSESLARYDRVRQVLDKPSELLAQRFKGEGTRARLERLLELNK